MGLAARKGRLGHTAVIAVVPHHQRDEPAGLFGERRAVIGPHVPAGETRGQVRRLAENAIALDGGNRQAHGHDLRPVQVILVEEFADARNPAADHRFAAELGIGGTLQHFGADRLAMLAHGREFGGGGPAVGADKNQFAHAVSK